MAAKTGNEDDISAQTEYKNEGTELELLPVSDESVHPREGFARRLTHGTAKAMGMAKDTDFDKLKAIQRHRAHSLAGQSGETQKMEKMVDMMHHAADSEGEEEKQEEDDFIKFAKLPLDKNQLKDINKAFLEDMKNFKPTGHDEKSIHSDGFNELEAKIQRTVDSNQMGRAPRPMRRRVPLSHSDNIDEDEEGWRPTTKLGKESRDPSLNIHRDLSTLQGLSAQKTPAPLKKRTPSPQQGPKSRTGRQERRGTLFHNFYTDDETSPAKLALFRFHSECQMPTTRRTSKGEEPIQWDGDHLIAREHYQVSVAKDLNKAVNHLSTKSKSQVTGIGKNGVLNEGYTDVYPEDQGPERQRAVKGHGASIRLPLPPGESKSNYLYGKKALRNFNKFKEMELTVLREQLNENKFFLRMKLKEKKKRVEEAMQLAKEHYTTEHGIAPKLRSKFGMTKQKIKTYQSKHNLIMKKKTKHEAGLAEEKHSDAAIDHEAYRVHAGLRLQLESMKSYIPCFIIIITFLQTLGAIVMIGLAGIAPVSFSKTFSISKYETWGGMREVTYEHPTNVWIGPSDKLIVEMGGMFSPCIRKDNLVNLRNAKYHSQEASGLGCCEIAGSGAGTATEAECDQISVDWQIAQYFWSNVTCNNRDLSKLISFEPHKFKPCCYGYIGHCMLASYDHCKHIDGIWHSDAREHCSHTHCEEEVCNTWHVHTEASHDDESHLAPYSNVTTQLHAHAHKQFWRLLLGIFFHHGALHLVLVAIVQCLMAIEVEKFAGWGRLGAIYLISGYGGLLIGSVAKPYEPNVGGHGAAFGLLAMNFVELGQVWTLIESPVLPFVKLVALTVMGLGTGFMPQMNLFTLMGGFVFGILTSIIFLPYVTFNFWHAKARAILITVCSVITVLLFSMILFLFHMFQPIGVGSKNSPDCIIDNKCDAQSKFLDFL